MREIKFRAWDGTENRFYPWADDLLVSCSGKIFEVDYDDVEEGTPIECFNCFEIEQFTGLHDKNGKEIYENDICKIRFDIDKIEDYIYASLTEKEIRTCERVFVVESPLFNNQPELNADIIEIIGNIHENPELLND